MSSVLIGSFHYRTTEIGANAQRHFPRGAAAWRIRAVKEGYIQPIDPRRVLPNRVRSEHTNQFEEMPEGAGLDVPQAPQEMCPPESALCFRLERQISARRTNDEGGTKAAISAAKELFRCFQQHAVKHSSSSCGLVQGTTKSRHLGSCHQLPVGRTNTSMTRKFIVET
jgi:hypothetical protein